MDKETTAIFRLQQASEMSERLYNKPLVVTYSGGKDSDVLLYLADKSGVDYEVKHNLTTVDAPQTVYHIYSVFHRLEDDGIRCSIDVHQRAGGGRNTMWNLIPHQMTPPTPLIRYCCRYLKEVGNKGSFAAMGVRWSESRRRSERAVYEVISKKKQDRVRIMSMDNDQDRQVFESCPIKSERTVAPIIDWTDQDIWDYIESNHIDTNPLYQCGFDRIGCIGCPLIKREKREFEFSKYPKYKENYIRAFDRMLQARKERGKPTDWKTGEQVFERWLAGKGDYYG